MKELGFSTKAIHSGNLEDQYGALTMPIYSSSTFKFKSCEDGAAKFTGEVAGYVYSRTTNPTVDVVQAKIAALEGGEAALATSSGMGAISSALWTNLSAGDHLVADKTLYGCTFELLSHHCPRLGIEVSMIDTSDEHQLRQALRPNTRVVYLETPANPNLKITDIRKVSDIAHSYNAAIKVICDNTFASPYLQNPLREGADLVVHSATKYINGHGDLLAGFVVGSAEDIQNARMIGVKDMTGSVLAANEAFLIIRGLKTIELRMQRHCDNAEAMAQLLQQSPKIERVYYPGLPEHPGHEIAARQMPRGFGGMLSFEVKGGRAVGAKLLNSLQLCALAVSLGDAETLFEHPASMTHATYTAEELAKAGIPEGLVRVSAGLENTEDILADIEQALAKL